jgi:actin-like ATPase involved in cell morphogenesis
MTDNSDKDDKNREVENMAAKIQNKNHQAQEETDWKDANPHDRAVGVDVGTSKIVLAEKKNGKIEFTSQRNAFILVDYSKFTEKILEQNQIDYLKNDRSLIVFGDGAETFASMLNTETRRPMCEGLLNPKEPFSIEIIKEILNSLVQKSQNSDIRLSFSIPDAPKDTETDIIYHETILRRHLESKGYRTKGINEGLAVIFSELEVENFTGLGISFGGGMCNVCLAYLSVPLISFSISKGGDYIDDAVSSVTGKVSTRVRTIKENGFNLSTNPHDDVEDALRIYYDDLITTMVKSLKESIIQTSDVLKVDRPVPIVLSGGTAKAAGFKDRFEHFLKAEEMPLDFSKIRLAKDPINATAKGALIAAMHES